MKQNILVPALAFAVIAACGVSHNKRQAQPSGEPQAPRNPLTAPPTSDTKPSESTSAQADGTITSGGGYVYGYEANPWFLGNVTTVKYCVDIDNDHFGISQSKAEASIVRAIDLWKLSFKHAKFTNHREEPLGTLVLGTQDFKLVDCAEGDIDLRFQLGKISAEQKKILGNPRRFVAATVQQHYDGSCKNCLESYARNDVIGCGCILQKCRR